MPILGILGGSAGGAGVLWRANSRPRARTDRTILFSGFFTGAPQAVLRAQPSAPTHM